MTYSQKLRGIFPEISLSWEDLLLLETFQIKYLPDRVAVKEFSTLLHTHPVLHRFLISKYPPIGPFLNGILEENKPVGDREIIDELCQEALWEIADLIIYNKHPEQFDIQAPIRWKNDEITAITSLEGKVVADVGAGSGRIAFLVAPQAYTVFAVEPVATFRTYMKEKAIKKGVKNLYVLNGTLDSIPLPDQSLDVLITSNAIGWNLTEELNEIQRVVKPRGHAIHLLQADEKDENSLLETLTSSPWNYTCLREKDENRMKLRYYKQINQ
ncbi:MAG: class I SAM-dependent methyltransferase [Bacteroidota bacterium]|nr:class I SAM-dependent methyltransferase [Bacteroidota bacterium]